MANFEKNPRDPVIVVSVRSAVGKAKRGTLANTRPDDFLADVMKGALAKVPALKPEMIDDVVIGTASPEAEQGLNTARACADLAGIPASVPAETINRFCSSGVQSIAHGAHAIMAGWVDVVMAGGTESMSLLPMGGHHPLPNPTLVETHPEACPPRTCTASSSWPTSSASPAWSRTRSPSRATTGLSRRRRPAASWTRSSRSTPRSTRAARSSWSRSTRTRARAAAPPWRGSAS